VAARVRVFAKPGQKLAVTRTVTIQIWAPTDVATRPFRIESKVDETRGVATNAHTVFAQLRVCVPARGYAEVRVTTLGQSTVYGDMKDNASSAVPRQAGIYLDEIDLADELGAPCRPGESLG
jgi:hypothetical protein